MEEQGAAPEVEPVEPQPQPEPQAPQIDIDTAYRIIAEQEGWDPRLTRFQMEDLKRRREELEKERRDLERQREQYARPEYPEEVQSDPYRRDLYEIKQRLNAWDERERKREQEAELTSRVGREVGSAYESLARQAGLSREQIAAQEGEFMATLVDMYPGSELIQQVGPSHAAQMAWRVFKGQNSGGIPGPAFTGSARMRPQMREVVIPGGVVQTGIPNDQDAKRRPGETNEQHVMRLRKMAEEAGVSARIADGKRVTIE